MLYLGSGVINTGYIVDPDLTEIGGHAVLGGKSVLVSHTLAAREDGAIVFTSAPIKIGSRVTLGGEANVGRGCQGKRRPRSRTSRVHERQLRIYRPIVAALSRVEHAPQGRHPPVGDSMLSFYINRAGGNLPADRKWIPTRAKTVLRRLFRRE
ncbi:MAG: DUF3175 domain-containing protein [Stellaceae bacterium]